MITGLLSSRRVRLAFRTVSACQLTLVAAASERDHAAPTVRFEERSMMMKDPVFLFSS